MKHTNNLPVKLIPNAGVTKIEASMMLPDLGMDAEHGTEFDAASIHWGKGPTVMAFNPTFLAACVDFAGYTLHAKDGLTPIKLTGKGERIAVLMPVRLS